jgi:EAL domain-containing protein (putative c-di-GMP-specific phosphodiesterase class I)
VIVHEGTASASLVEQEIAYVLEHPGSTSVELEPIVSLTSSRLLAIEGLTRSTRIGSRELFRRATALGLDLRLEVVTLGRLIERFLEEHASARLSVNVSPRALASPTIRDLLAPYAAQLVVEISEEAIVEDPAELVAGLAPLRAAGLEVALDNVGVGFAGLTLLVELTPEWVKLDRRVVQGQGTEPLLATLTTLAHRVGARVVGVGVETEDELARLEAVDADAWQGYLSRGPVRVEPDCVLVQLVRPLPVPAGATVTLDLADSISLSLARWSRGSLASLDDVARVSDGCFDVGWVRYRDLVGFARSW